MSPSDTNSFFSGPVGMCVSAKAVYGWFKNGDPSATDGASQTWEKVSSLQAEVSTLINKAVQESGATWTGTASDSMRTSTSPLSEWADITSQSAKSGSTAIADVSSAFRNAQNSVQEPVEIPDKPWYNSAVPWDTDYDDAVEESQGVDEANLRVINTYADRTNTSMSTMPTFEAPPDSTAEIDDGSSESSSSSIDKINNNQQYTNNQTSTSSSSSNGSDGSGEQVKPFTPTGTGTGTGETGTSGTGNNGGGDGTTKPSDVNDPSRPSVGTPGRPSVGMPGLPGVGDPSGFVPFGPNDPRNPANKLGSPGSPGAGRGGGGAGGGGASGGRGGGLGGGGLGGGAGTGAGGRGGLGPGAAAAAGQFGGASGTAGGEGGRSGAGGVGPGGAAAGGRGATGAGAGAGAMGGGQGARGEGGDDLEHTSKYLQPSDEYFGDGTMVAPPVIGG